MKSGENYIYPPTTADQVIVGNGKRLSGVGVYLEKPEESEDTTLEVGVNADTLGGILPSGFVQNSEFNEYKNEIDAYKNTVEQSMNNLESNITSNVSNLESDIAENYLMKTETAANSENLGGIAPDGFVKMDDVLSYNAIKSSSSLDGKLPSAQALTDGLGRFGKQLWSGSFKTGSITVPDLSTYNVIIVRVNNVIMIGTRYYGYGGHGTYNSNGMTSMAYRYTVSGNTLTVDDICRGCWDSTGNQQTVTHIYGLF